MTETPNASSGRPMVRVAALTDLPEGKLKLVKAAHARVLLVRTQGEIRALSGICTHARVFLGPGRLDAQGLIECPSHGAKFSPVDGAVHCPPATVPLELFEVFVSGEDVFVDPGEAPVETAKA